MPTYETLVRDHHALAFKVARSILRDDAAAEDAVQDVYLHFLANPDALSRLRHVGTVLLDKTGTLTEGRTTVTRWEGSEAALQLARALESESSHAVARAFRVSSGRPVMVVRDVDEVCEVPGQGISGTLDGHVVRVGNRLHVEAGGATLAPRLDAAADAFVAEGLSPVFVTVDGAVSGVAGVGDPLRSDSKKTVQALLQRGIRVRILSGDHPSIVARVAAELGIPAGDALGGLSPEEKRDVVAGLSAIVGTAGSSGQPEKRGAVVMVGDGVNDAAALALADVGIAVHGGMGASIVAADIVLTREGVAPLLEILDGARRLRRVIWRNLGFSLVYNAAAGTLALLGFVGPLLAALMMPVSSLTVVLSSAFSGAFPRPGRVPAGEA